MTEHRRSEADRRRDRELAERWRAVGLGMDAVWVVVLLLVVAFWANVTWAERPAFSGPGYLPALLAPAALLAAVLAGWAIASAVRILRRRGDGWDAPIVLGVIGIAVAAFSFVPSETIVRPLLWVGVLGLFSLVAGILGERSWHRAGRPVDEVSEAEISEA